MKITITTQEIRDKFKLPQEAKLTIEGIPTVAQSKTIRNLTNKFVEVAQGKGISLYYTNEYKVDADIFNWLPSATDDGTEIPKHQSTQLPAEGMTEGDMLKTALKLPLAHAINAMTTKLIEGYFDETKKVFIIYLTDIKDGVPLGLIGRRYGDGKLYLRVNKVNTGNRWDVGDSAVSFLSNPL